MSLNGTYINIVLTGTGFPSKCKVARTLRTKKTRKVEYLFRAIYKTVGVFKYPKAFQCEKRSDFKRNVTRFLKKYNAGSTTTTYKHSHTAFLEAFKKELLKSCLRPWILKIITTLKKYQQFWLTSL